MSFEEFLKALNPEQAELVNKYIESITTAKDKTISELTEQLGSANSEVDKLKKTKPAEAAEDIFKDVSPEVKAHIEKLQGAVNDLVKAQEETLANERFAKVKALPVDESELKTVLKSVSPAVFSILEKAAGAIEAGLVAKGKQTEPDAHEANAENAYAKLEKSARKLMEESEKMTFEQAFTITCEQDAETYKQYLKGVN